MIIMRWMLRLWILYAVIWTVALLYGLVTCDWGKGEPIAFFGVWVFMVFSPLPIGAALHSIIKGFSRNAPG